MYESPYLNLTQSKVPQIPHFLPETTDSLQQAILDASSEEFGQPRSYSGHETSRDLVRKRKRSQEAGSPQIRDEPIGKRIRASLESGAVKDKEAPRNTDDKQGHPINHWITEGSWPKEYFQRDYMLPRKKRSFASLQYENLEVNTSCIGGDGTQAARNPEYEKQLSVAGIYLDEDKATISEDEADLCRSFLDANQPVPKISLFQDDLFKATTSRYRHRSEAMVFRDITPLITPSAELLYAFGSTHLVHLREEIDTIWTKCICLASGPRPKPDFAVGLKSSAFTEVELEKLTPYVGGYNETCFVKVTNNIFFPFLTCEAKCGEVGVCVADRQNAHSASIAVNAVVQLYKAVSREKEVDRKILAFSVSHNNEYVKIYGHYALIQGDRITFYQHPIKKFDFTSEEGKEKWTAYTLVKNLYDKFFPIHLERVKSAIIQLPDPKTLLVSSLTSIVSADESELPNPQEVATSVSSSQDWTNKKPRLPPKVMLQKENDRLNEALKQRDEQFMLQINQLMNQQKEQMDQQKEQMGRQMDELKKERDDQKEQIKELMNMLKQRLT